MTNKTDTSTMKRSHKAVLAFRVVRLRPLEISGTGPDLGLVYRWWVRLGQIEWTEWTGPASSMEGVLLWMIRQAVQSSFSRYGRTSHDRSMVVSYFMGNFLIYEPSQTTHEGSDMVLLRRSEGISVTLGDRSSYRSRDTKESYMRQR